MIDFNQFSIFSVMGKKAGKQTEQEYPRTVLNEYDKFLAAIKDAKAEIESNRNKGIEGKEMYL